MGVGDRIKTALRGSVRADAVAREVFRRVRVARHLSRERGLVDQIAAAPARLTIDRSELQTQLGHEGRPSFWAPAAAGSLPPQELSRIIAVADRIVDNSAWEMLGFHELSFIGDAFWRRDPLSGRDWGLDFHADVDLAVPGNDVRILWELNRFGHVVPLALAFAATRYERYAEVFFSHVETWMEQNPYGRGANWGCAMEVALRVINLLASFDLFRISSSATPERMTRMLRLFDQHGRFIVDNSEFSYISTSNHYFSNVAGLFWLGTLMPELAAASTWREIGRRELDRELRKQMQPDGSHFESATGYHRFITELTLYTFLLARRWGLDIEESSLDFLRKALEYIRSIIRPDSRMPLIGDADGSQIIPIVRRDADECAYLLQLGARFFDDAEFDLDDSAPEARWVFGEQQVGTAANDQNGPASTVSPDAGAYVMRSADLYLHFNANDCGLLGRGSHGHNDALSIEVCAFGIPFIVDPGSYVYNLDRSQRDLFRSTAYHSTVMVDSAEQNTIWAGLPFKLGNEARPKVIDWHSDEQSDRVAAEHYGYRRLGPPIVHRRTITFDKVRRYWHVLDELLSKGEHVLSFRFHIADHVSVSVLEGNVVELSAQDRGRLLICAMPSYPQPIVSDAFVSRNYGHRAPSRIVDWKVTSAAPVCAKWLLIPVSCEEDVGARSAAVKESHIC